jgi:hypothetical protein
MRWLSCRSGFGWSEWATTVISFQPTPIPIAACRLGAAEIQSDTTSRTHANVLSHAARTRSQISVPAVPPSGHAVRVPIFDLTSAANGERSNSKPEEKRST